MASNAAKVNVQASQTPEESKEEKPGLTNEVDSAPGFNNVRLNPEEQDEVLISLGEYLLDENLAEFAKSCISLVDNKDHFKYLGCLARVKIQEGNPGTAIDDLEAMVKMVPVWVQGYIEIGHAHYKMNQQKNNEAALKSYMKAIRIGNLSGQEITDQLVY